MILRAAEFAIRAHEGQTRKFTGRPYIEHPMRVAGRVMLIPGVIEEVVAVAWLHDVLEDCPDFVREFWDLVEDDIFSIRMAQMVKELTNPSKDLPELSRRDRKHLDREHLAKACGWSKVIKLIDRIDNVQEISAAPVDYQWLYTNESLALLHAVIANETDPELRKLHDELFDLIDKIQVQLSLLEP